MAPGKSHRSGYSSLLEWIPFFFFLLNGEQKYPMPVHCCPGFPEQEGVLAVPLHTLFLSLFSKEKES